MNSGPNRIHVLHIIYRLDFGGLENGLVNLVNRLPKTKFTHTIVCLSGYSTEFRARIKRDDVKVISIDKKPGKDLAAYGRMWRVMREVRPDVVHTRNLGTVDMQWVARLAGVPHRVHGEHGWDTADPDGMLPRNLRIRRGCQPVIDRYVALSADIASWLSHSVAVPAAKICQIYNGVDCQRFHPAAPERAALAGVERPIVIGTVGRLVPIKNQAALLRAVAGLIEDKHVPRTGVRLHIVGDGPLKPELALLANQLKLHGVIEFFGARDDIPELLREMDVFVLPSINEGVSNTILEAMASGLPVIAARTGGNPELIVHGSTGLLYKNGDGTLESALQAHLTQPDLRISHGQAGRRRVMEEFSLEAMVSRYDALYDHLVMRPTASLNNDQTALRVS